MGLTEIIQQRIKDEDVICFQEFMEMCLYYPELGYYTSPRNKIGKNGDFYTSAYLHAVNDNLYDNIEYRILHPM